MRHVVDNPTRNNPANAGEEAPRRAEEMWARISGLDAEDKADVLDLFLAMPAAMAEPAELNAIALAISDILNQKRNEVKLVETDLPNDEEAEQAAPPTEWKKFVSKKIRGLREERKWTQQELAGKSNLTQSHICRIEGQKLSPSRKTIEKIAAAFGVALKELDPSVES